MAESAWKKTVTESSLESGKPVAVTVDGQEIMVVRLGDRIAACGAKCSHYGAPLDKGLITGEQVICPWHNARFDINTGKKESPPGLADIPTFDVKSEDGDVYVRPREQNDTPTRDVKAGSVLILGAGAAGDTAAETLRAGGFAGKIAMVTQEQEAPYDRTVLSKDFITGEAKPEWLPLRDADFYRKGEIEVMTRKRIVEFDPATKTATFADGGKAQADKVLLCTGSVPRKLGIAGSELPNCFYLRSMKDAERLAEAVGKGSKAVVLGASFIGLETAAGMRARNIEVHIVAPETVPLATVFGERVGRRIQRIHEDNGVNFHLGHTAREIGGSGTVDKVVLDDGSTITADIVIIGVGVLPATDYLETSGLLENGAIPVNSSMETKFPGVYAAGDIAVVPDTHNDGSVRIEHWVVAQRHGMHAARAMLGSTEPYREPPFFWTMQYGNSIKFTGVAVQYDEIVYRGDVDNDAFSAGYFQKGTLKAVSTIGKGRDVLIGSELLKGDVAVSPAQFHDTEDLEELLPS